MSTPDKDRVSPEGATFRVYNARSLGLAIRDLRLSRGLNQDDLAAQLGIPRRYISTLERGHSTEQVERLLSVLKTLDARLVVQEHPGW